MQGSGPQEAGRKDHSTRLYGTGRRWEAVNTPLKRVTL